MAEDKGTELLALIKKHFEDNNVTEIRENVFKAENQELITVIGWDLVPEVGSHMTESNSDGKPEIVQISEDILDHLAKTGNAKELLLAFLEQIDMFKDDIKFKALLTPIQTVLLRLPAKRQHSLDITLETLYAHIQELPKPTEYNLEGEEKYFIDTDPIVSRISDVVSVMLNFLQPFVDEVVAKRQNVVDSDMLDTKILGQRQKLIYFLFRMLSHPLVYADLSFDDTDPNATESNLRLCAEMLMLFLGKLHGNFANMLLDIRSQNSLLESKRIENNEDESEDRSLAEENISNLALGCFNYLLHSEHMSVVYYPAVFTSQYVLKSCLKDVIILLKRQEISVNHKGVMLARSLINRMPRDTLTECSFENSHYTDFLQSLVPVMTLCPDKEVRQKAVQILPKFLSCFTVKGRYRFLLFLLNNTSHAGVMGYVIHLLKEEINQNLAAPMPNEIFIGKSAEKILKYPFLLPDGATTDLLDQSDKILASLNLLRYLLIRDKSDINITHIWNLVPDIDHKLLLPLRTGIDMSRAHYQLELKNLKQGGNETENLERLSVTVGGQNLPSMQKEQQVQVMHMALHTFDMIDSVLSRVNELIDSNKQLVSG